MISFSFSFLLFFFTQVRLVSEEIRLPHRIRNDDVFIHISVEIVFFDEGDLPLVG